MKVFYETLAPWWPLISPVEEYEGEARQLLHLVVARAPGAQAVLELGSGGGHVAFHLKRRFTLTLTDLSRAMLDVSERLNPECRHVQGDMRTLHLPGTFDVVLVHDAIDYMTSEEDLESVFRNAHRHLRPGGLLVCVPDHVRERFEPGVSCGGADGPDGRAVRYLEWSHAVAPGDASCTTHFAFLVREPDGTVRSLHEAHAFGLFAEATWTGLLERAGFDVEALDEEDVEPGRAPRRIFVGRRGSRGAPGRPA